MRVLCSHSHKCILVHSDSDIWPLLICEWFEMFEAHSWHCLLAQPRAKPCSVWSVVAVVGSLVGQRGKFDLKIHTEGHTQLQRRCCINYCILTSIRDKGHIFVFISVFGSSFSFLDQNSFSCLNFSRVSASGLHRNMTSDTSAICTLLTWEYWSHKGKDAWNSLVLALSSILSATLVFWRRYVWVDTILPW